MAFNKLPETILLQLYKHLGRQQPRLFSLVFLVNSYRQYLFFTCKLMKPYSALLVTSYCTLHTKIASACLCSGSGSAERAGQGEVAAVTPILAWIGLESAILTL